MYKEIVDPIENNPDYQEILEKVNAKAKEEARRDPSSSIAPGHTFWNIKKMILKDEYGIDWKSPPELNPEVSYE